MSAIEIVAAVMVIANAVLILVNLRALRRIWHTQMVLNTLVRRERRWRWSLPDGTPPDPTAQDGVLTEGQRIVAAYEQDVIGEPCELAEAIDRAIWNRRP